MNIFLLVSFFVGKVNDWRYYVNKLKRNILIRQFKLVTNGNETNGRVAVSMWVCSSVGVIVWVCVVCAIYEATYIYDKTEKCIRRCLWFGFYSWGRERIWKECLDFCFRGRTLFNFFLKCRDGNGGCLDGLRWRVNSKDELKQ